MFIPKTYTYLFLSSAAFTLASCRNNVIEKLEQKKFFSLKTYFETEAVRLDKSKLLVAKKVSENGKTESKTLTDVKWAEELAFVGESDINRIAWVDKYSVDTVSFDDNNLVTYVALDENLAVKRVALTFNKETNECLSVSVEKGTDNFLYSSWQKIFYTPGNQLNIYGHLSVRWLFEKDYATDFVIVQTEELDN